MISDRNNPIGIMDSGVGGLAIYRALRETLPHEQFIYFADTAYCPYGALSDEALDTRINAVAAGLVQRGVKAIVVACNTATVRAVSALRDQHDIPIVGIEPGIKPASAASKTRKVVLLATPKTLVSQSVARLREQHGTDLHVFNQPCPGLVEAVEAGDIHSDATRALLHTFLKPVDAEGADVVILGCTHFIFLEPVIRQLIDPNVTIIEPSYAIARQLAKRLDALSLQAEMRSLENDRLVTTAEDADHVGRIASQLLGKSLAGEKDFSES